ncbi:hypothetical protein KI387_042598, partial [Taxus chinensis]
HQAIAMAMAMAADVMGFGRPACHALIPSKSNRTGNLSTHFTSLRISVGKSIYSYKPVKTTIVMMGKREQEIKEIREKNIDDINEQSWIPNGSRIKLFQIGGIRLKQ